MTPPHDPVPIDGRGLPAGYHFRPDLELTPRAAADALRAGELLLIDCREDRELALARIDGAVHVPLARLADDPSEADPGDRRAVAVICHHGVRSLQAALILRAAGRGDARSVAGGIDLWSRTVDPSIPRYSSRS